MLARDTPYLPKQLLRLSYTALIRSHLEYCSLLYTSVAKTSKTRGSAMAEGQRDALVSRNSVTTKHPI